MCHRIPCITEVENMNKMINFYKPFDGIIFFWYNIIKDFISNCFSKAE